MISQPIVKQITIQGRDAFEMFSPLTGEQVAVIYNAYFITQILQRMFGLSDFEGVKQYIERQDGNMPQ